jgi:predicted dehydrogenase
MLESREGYVNIRMSANPEEAKRRINVLHGTKASFMFSYKTAMPLAERMRARPASDLIRRGISSRLAPSKETEEVRQPHDEVIRRFVDHVLHGAPPPTSPEEALHVEELTEQFGEMFESVVPRPARRKKARS